MRKQLCSCVLVAEIVEPDVDRFRKLTRHSCSHWSRSCELHEELGELLVVNRSASFHELSPSPYEITFMIDRLLCGLSWFRTGPGHRAVAKERKCVNRFQN